MKIALAVVLVLLLVEGAAAQLTMQFSGDIIVPRDTTHQGTALTMNGRIVVDGTLRGDAMTMNGDVSVTGTVTGSVRTFNGNISLAPTAVVGGDVWTANGRINQAPGAQVRGRIRAETVPPSSPPASPQTPPSRVPPVAPAPPVTPPQVGPLPPLMPGPSRPWDGTWYPWWSRVMRAVATVTLVGFVVLAALVTAVFPRQIRTVASTLSAAPGESLLAGLAVWVLLPPLSVVLAMSIVGIPIVVMLPFLVAAVGLAGVAGVAVLIGERIVGAFQRERSDALDAVVGAALLGVLAFLPVIGWLAILVAVTWGLGSVIILLFRRVRERPPAVPPAVPPATPA
jgi:cytoskeletal protein CcmA (bactofilin family)